MAKLIYEVKDEIAWIRMNRPEVLNALSSEELAAFVISLQQAADDPAVKAIIISSVGDSFCAGEDLKIALEEYAQIKTGEIHPILDIVEDITEGLQAIPRIIRMARKVVIASVRGLAVGGGFEIAIDSDLIVAADNARFGFPEGNAGMTITGGASKLLPMSIGLNKARELVLTGEFIDAAEAYRIGLVNRLVPAGEEDAEAERLARRIMTRAPFSVVNHKRMLQNAAEAGFEATLEMEKQTVTNMIYTEDYGEAISAFGDKRTPTFKGR
jgi:enoyl-CoA hydratase